jgi:hypothetical protein
MTSLSGRECPLHTGILAFHFGKMLFTFFESHGPPPPLTGKTSARKARLEAWPSVRERLRQYAASHPHPATPRNVAGAAQAVPPAAAAQPVSHVAVAARNSASAASPAGTQESATRPARRPPGTVSPNEVRAGNSNRRKVSQDPVKRDAAGHVDMNHVRVKIRKIVHEGFNLPGS